MNIKMSVFVVLALIISIFANIALGFNLSSKNEENQEFSSMNKKLKEEIKKLKVELYEAEGVITDEKLAVNGDAKKVVENFFKTHYEYNSDTYKERYEKIKPFLSEDVYGQLTTAGIPNVPNVKFENKINNLELYLTAENKELTGLVLIDTVYKVDGVENPETTQIFQVTVGEKDGQQKIKSLEVLGTFTSMSES